MSTTHWTPDVEAEADAAEQHAGRVASLHSFAVRAAVLAREYEAACRQAWPFAGAEPQSWTDTGRRAKEAAVKARALSEAWSAELATLSAAVDKAAIAARSRALAALTLPTAASSYDDAKRAILAAIEEQTRRRAQYTAMTEALSCDDADLESNVNKGGKTDGR